MIISWLENNCQLSAALNHNVNNTRTIITHNGKGAINSTSTLSNNEIAENQTENRSKHIKQETEERRKKRSSARTFNQLKRMKYTRATPLIANIDCMHVTSENCMTLFIHS